MAEPTELVMANGWGPTNLRLIAEWETYLEAMVQTSEIYAPEDATSFIADLRAGVAAGTAMQLQRFQQQKDHAWSLEYAVLHPMARPAGHAPVKVRWSPLSKESQV